METPVKLSRGVKTFKLWTSLCWAPCCCHDDFSNHIIINGLCRSGKDRPSEPNLHRGSVDLFWCLHLSELIRKRSFQIERSFERRTYHFPGLRSVVSTSHQKWAVGATDKKRGKAVMQTYLMSRSVFRRTWFGVGPMNVSSKVWYQHMSRYLSYDNRCTVGQYSPPPLLSGQSAATYLTFLRKNPVWPISFDLNSGKWLCFVLCFYTRKMTYHVKGYFWNIRGEGFICVQNWWHEPSLENLEHVNATVDCRQGCFPWSVLTTPKSHCRFY